MKLLRAVPLVMLALVLLASSGGAFAQDTGPIVPDTAPQAANGTGFSYDGRLFSGGAGVTGTCDFEFSLWNAAGGGTQVGGTHTVNGVIVTAGLFSTEVNSGAQFGPTAYNGDARWLAIAVRCPTNTGGFTALTPRQALAPTPYAHYALAAGSASAVPWTGITGMPAGFADGVDDVGGGGAAWQLTGNGGTIASNFLGTTDNVALTLRVSNTVGLRLIPSATTPSLLGGYSGNSVSAGVAGAVIGGGGSSSIFGANTITASFAVIGGGAGNNALGTYATVSGGSQNTAGQAGAVGGGSGNEVVGSHGTIAGGQNNLVNGLLGVVGGGSLNTIPVTAEFGTIGGGEHNTAGDHAVVGGGESNWADGSHAVIAGGYNITATADYATVGGGWGNTANGVYSFVGGGLANLASGNHATVAGGFNNMATGNDATAAGGLSNVASGTQATVGGGYSNEAASTYATIGGGYDNAASGYQATVAGGTANIANVEGATVGGGYSNQADDTYTTIGGGWDNWASGTFATVAGGESNLATGNDSTVAGGEGNFSTGYRTFIGGGFDNLASGSYATVAGGRSNSANWDNTTVGGGYNNLAGGNSATVSGGSGNSAGGDYATVPGGIDNRASGAGSIAMGSHARAAHPGSFIFADVDSTNVISTTANNQFVVRAAGGYYLYTNSGLSNGCILAAGGGSWSCGSDRYIKSNFSTVDGVAVLNTLMTLPIETWNYNTQDPSIRHMGPMAQDWFAAYGLGEGEKTITGVDADGVALAAIQGLYTVVQEKEARISALEATVAALQADAGQARDAEAAGGYGQLLLGLGLGAGIAAGAFLLGRAASRKS
jgi:hypothetical protein